MIDVEKLKKLHEAATKGDLSTAERHVAEEHIECPVCQGDGEVLASDYCNIDGKALGVQFYGIGNEFGAHEALWTYLVHSVPAILAMAEERERMREALSNLYAAVNARAVRGRDHVPSMRDEQRATVEALKVLRALGEEKA